METTLHNLVQGYKPSKQTIQLVKETPIVLLVGVSGAGKDTIKQELLNTGKYHHIVSHTTRAPRENQGVMEQNGVEYHFISKEQAVNMLKNGEFVEAKEFGGNLYGTSAAEVQWARDDGKVALTDVEVQGVAEYRAISSDVIAEFILPPDYTEWQTRLHKRYGGDGADPADIKKRMQTAVSELTEALEKPYYHFIINDNLEDAVRVADEIACKAGDDFSRADRSFHVWAEKLLDDLRLHHG